MSLIDQVLKSHFRCQAIVRANEVTRQIGVARIDENHWNSMLSKALIDRIVVALGVVLAGKEDRAINLFRKHH